MNAYEWLHIIWIVIKRSILTIIIYYYQRFYVLLKLSLTIDDSEEADDTPVYKKDKRFKLVRMKDLAYVIYIFLGYLNNVDLENKQVSNYHIDQ